MFKNQVSYEIQEIKRIRVCELGLTQREVATKGLSRDTLSKIESGNKELTPAIAKIIAERFTQLGYKVKKEHFLGTEKNIIDEIMNRFHQDPKRYSDDIDKILEKTLDENKSVSIILQILNLLRKDIYRNHYSELILKYVLKLRKYKLDQHTYVKVNLDLIRAYFILGNYDRAIMVSNDIKNLIYELESKEEKAKYYLSIANAYYLLEEYTFALNNISELKKIKLKNKENYLKALTIESSILTKEKMFEDSIVLNKKIISIAKKIGMEDYIANSKSNIAFMYMEMGLLDEAGICLDEAFNLYNNVNIQCKINLMNNKLYLSIKQGNIDINLFKKVIQISLKAKDFNIRDSNIETVINYGIKLKKSEVFFIDILKFLKKCGIKVKPELKLLIIAYLCEKSKKSKEIQLILQITEQ